jgi:hypothetical protein
MSTQRQYKQLEVQLARYQHLERHVTDPLAAHLLRVVVAELEADLKNLGSPSAPAATPSPGS